MTSDQIVGLALDALIEWRDAKLAHDHLIQRALPRLDIPPIIMIRLRNAEARLLEAACELPASHPH